MKRICWFLLFSSLVAMEEIKVDIPPSKSTCDLFNEEHLQRSISNYFKENPEILYPHIAETLKRKIEESSGDGYVDATLGHVRDSIDLEKLTQSLITDVLREALEHKYQSDSGHEAEKNKNKAKTHIYTAMAGLLTTVTGILVTYFLSNS